jgi:hypothetical protein
MTRGQPASKMQFSGTQGSEGGYDAVDLELGPCPSHGAMNGGLFSTCLAQNRVHVNAMFLVGFGMQVFGKCDGETDKMEVSRVKDDHPAWSRSSAIPQSRGSD